MVFEHTPEYESQWATIRSISSKSGMSPGPVRGTDPDNGSEFINKHPLRSCETKRITFTRSRAYRKNNACYVEQKNWTVLRRNVGYARFDSPEELEALNDRYAALREHTNVVVPSAKLLTKT